MYVMLRNDMDNKAVIFRADRYIERASIDNITDGVMVLNTAMSYLALFLDAYKDYDTLYDVPVTSIGYLDSMFASLKQNRINLITKKKYKTKSLEFLSTISFLISIGYGNIYCAKRMDDLMKLAEGFDVFVID